MDKGRNGTRLSAHESLRKTSPSPLDTVKPAGWGGVWARRVRAKSALLQLHRERELIERAKFPHPPSLNFLHYFNLLSLLLFTTSFAPLLMCAVVTLAGPGGRCPAPATTSSVPHGVRTSRLGRNLGTRFPLRGFGHGQKRYSTLGL